MKFEVNNIKTMVDLLDVQASADHEDKLFFLNSEVAIEQQMSYQLLRVRARSIAAQIQQYTTEGDRVLLVYQPGLEFICAFFACLYAGVIAVPVYPPAEKKLVEKLQAVILNSEPKLVLSTKKIVDQIAKLKYVKALQNIGFIDNLMSRFLKTAHEVSQWDFDKFTWINTDTLSLSLEKEYKEQDIHAEDIAFLQYTSGSTGQPKGVMVSHRNLLCNLHFINQTQPAKKNTVVIIWLPPYHDMGLIGGIFYPIYTGTPVYLMSPLTFLRDPTTWLRAITQYRGTVTSAPNFAYALCNRKIKPEQRSGFDLSSMDAFLNGAEPVNAGVMDEFANNFSVCGFRKEMFMPCYGLAEATLMVCGVQGVHVKEVQKHALRRNQVIPEKSQSPTGVSLVSSGYVVAEELKIVHPETRQHCGDEQIGEIWIDSDSVTQGYWQQPQLTEEYFHAHCKDFPKQQFLRTGDLGFISAGALYVVGRCKDLIIINGKNYYPHDIEASMERAHPAIRAGACAAFNVSDGEQEQLAVVGELHEALADADYTAIIAALRQQIWEDHSLSVYQIALITPRSLPKTTSGKIKRKTTREALVDGTLSSYHVWARDDDLYEAQSIVEEDQNELTEKNENEFIQNLKVTMQQELADLLSVSPEQIDEHKNFAELGLDSLMAVELENRLQRALKGRCKLPEASIVNHPSIEQLMAFIHSLVNEEQEQRITQARPFSEITIPARITKPRQQGLTSIIDTGLSVPETQALINTTSDYIDVLKLGFGTSRLYPEAVLSQKIALLRAANILVCPGGTFFEIARQQQQVAYYLEEALRLGFDAIEFSDGVFDIPLEEKFQYINQAKEMGFKVLVEVGKKEASADELLTTNERINEIKALLEAGAWKVILEGRESGTTGLFRTDTTIKADDFTQIVSAVDPESLIFEAPVKHQQAWLINHLGANVNLANIAPRDVLALEALRCSLRADTIRGSK